MHWKSNSILFHKPASNIFYHKGENRAKNAALYDNLVKILSEDGNNVYFIEDRLPSIWVRDYFPINVDGDFILFRPCLDYMCHDQIEEYKRYRFQHLNKLINVKRCHRCNLILDGGNIIFNSDYVLTTQRVYENNRNKDKKQIDKTLQSLFNGRKLIVLEAEDEHDDPTGHVDGLANFIDNDTLVLNDYSIIDRDLFNYNRSLIEDKIETIVMPQYLTEKSLKINNDPTVWLDVEGNYVNFIGTTKSLIFCKYERTEYNEQVRELVERHNKLNRTIHFVDPSAVTKYGGALHCISWDFHRE